MRNLLLLGTSIAAIALSGCAATTKERGDARSADETSQTTPVVKSAGAPGDAMTNPLLAPWKGPFGGVPPWDQGSPGRYRSAIDSALAERRTEFAAIAGNPADPTFDNTLLPMQRAGRTLSRAARMFSVMTDNENAPEYQALNREVAPKLAAASDEIFFNEPLFKRIAAVHESRESAGLTAEQQRLVERTYESFVRSGAKLDAGQKERLSRINQELATLFTEFSDKVLADENTWVALESRADLAGLPESIVASAAAAAEERNLAGKWVIVNTRSSVDPFLTFSTRRDLREKVWRRFVNRGDNGDANDTNAAIRQIVKLRAERAGLLGYPSHAH